MTNEMKEASALGARTARACESCLKVRARWYCAADDAFLCHGCDNMVHSANQLASRHERVKLQTASSKVNYSVTPEVAWHSGFTRKARTPRHNNNRHSSLKQKQQQKPLHEERGEEEVFFNNTISLLPLVPELGSEEPLLNDETEEQLLCRVPVFDAELCSIYNEVRDEVVAAGEEALDLENFSSEFLPSDTDLAEFTADVKSFLGNGADEDSPDDDEHVKESELLILDCKEEEGDEEMDECIDGVLIGAKDAMVKVKDEEELDADDDTACHLDSILDMNGEAFNWNIVESESPAQAQEDGVSKVGTKKDIFLRLNYEEVITAWASQGSPWTNGTPPKFFNSDDCWLDFLGSNGGNVQCCYGAVGSLRVHADGGREARVSRYREKRRTRLFAKKIRYEVRKLNAEKRPRMKGRFVKRTSFVGATALPA
ncbi:Zinc finger protein CONSTANS-LIKE 16 [Glycine soja]